MRKYVVILAAGSGERFDRTGIPKQFATVFGKTILRHSVDACDCGVFDEMIVAVPDGMTEKARLEIGQTKHAIPVRIVTGGGTRTESCARCIACIEDDEAYVVIHNCDQPLVTRETFMRCVSELETESAVTTVVPCTYSVMKVGEGGYVSDIPDRSSFASDMGEESFRLSVLRKLFGGNSCPVGCSCITKCLMEAGLSRIKAIRGSRDNIKITYKSDIPIFEMHMKTAMSKDKEIGDGQAEDGAT